MNLLERFEKAQCKMNFIGISSNNIDNSCMVPLGKFLQRNPTFRGIRIGHQIDDEGINAISPYLMKETELRTFDVGGNKRITDKSIPIISKILEKSQISSFEVGETSIKDDHHLLLLQDINLIKNGAEKIDIGERYVLSYHLFSFSALYEVLINTSVKTQNIL